MWKSCSYSNLSGSYALILALAIGLILSLSVFPAYGQLMELEVEPIESNRVFVFPDFPDDAAVVLESSITGLQIDSNLDIIEDRSEPNEGIYRVIIYAARQQLYISAPGYQQFSFPTGNLNARDVLHLSVDPKDTGIRQTGDILVRSEPSGATIILEGLPGEYTTPYTFTNIMAQSYTMRLELDGYQPVERRIQVDPLRPNVEDVTLNLAYGFLDIDAEGAQLFLATEDVPEEYRVGFTPGEPLQLDMGTYEYRLSREHYLDAEGEFTIRPGGMVSLSPSLEPAFATLRVAANVEDIILSSSDNNAPPTDSRDKINLERGVRTVEVSAGGYESIDLRIQARPGERIDTTVTLELISEARERRRREELPRGILNIEADVPDTEIYVDGERRGEGDISTAIVPKVYDVELRHHKLGTKKISIEVPPADVASEFVNMRPSRATSIFLSTIIPGSGHIYSNRRRGYLYLIGALAGTGFAGYSYYEYMEADETVDEALQRYRAAQNPDAASRLRSEVLRKHDDRRQIFDNIRLGIAAFAGVYTLQLLDIHFFSPSYGYRGWPVKGVAAGFTRDGAGLTLNF